MYANSLGFLRNDIFGVRLSEVFAHENKGNDQEKAINYEKVKTSKVVVLREVLVRIGGCACLPSYADGYRVETQHPSNQGISWSVISRKAGAQALQNMLLQGGRCWLEANHDTRGARCCSARNTALARRLGASAVITTFGRRFNRIIAVNGYHPLSAHKHFLVSNGIFVMGEVPRRFVHWQRNPTGRTWNSFRTWRACDPLSKCLRGMLFFLLLIVAMRNRSPLSGVFSKSVSQNRRLVNIYVQVTCSSIPNDFVYR
jgi:hypothetical protein